MKMEYDLSRMKRRTNPYAARLKRQITIRAGVDILHRESVARALVLSLSERALPA